MGRAVHSGSKQAAPQSSIPAAAVSECWPSEGLERQRLQLSSAVDPLGMLPACMQRLGHTPSARKPACILPETHSKGSAYLQLNEFSLFCLQNE